MKSTSSTANLLKPLYRGLPIIAAVTAFFLFMASRYLKYSTPKYESTVKIKLADSKEGIPNSNLYKDFDVFATNNKIGTEIELLKSHVLAEKVVARLNLNPTIYRVGELRKEELYNASPLTITFSELEKKYTGTPIKVIVEQNGALKIGLPDGLQFSSAIGKEVNTGSGKITINYNAGLLKSRPNLQIADHYEFIAHDPEHLAKSIAAEMDVTSVDKDIPILRISFNSAVPQKSADIVNTLASVYINDYVEEKFKSADTTENFLVNQLKEYGEKLASSEAALKDYRDDNNIINIHQETETDLRKVADLKKQLASVSMNLEAIDTLNKYVTNNKQNFLQLAPNFEAFTDLLSTEMVKQIKQLQAEKRDLLMKYTPEHEKVQVVDRKIQDLSDYLIESIGNTAKNLRIKRDNLEETIAAAESEFKGLPEKEKSMTILERNFGMNEQIYRFLQGKETEANIAKTATISFHRIISRGDVPTKPVSPVRNLIFAFTGFLGLLFSIIGIYLVHGAKARVDNENIISRNSDIPIEFSVPFAKNEQEKKTIFNRWALELDLKHLTEGRTICVSSQRENEGKKFVATGLAEAVASLGKRTLLVMAEYLPEDPVQLKYDVISTYSIMQDWKIPELWADILARWKCCYHTIIIQNASTTDENAAIIPMCTSDMNVYLVDSRLTRIKDLQSIEELKSKLQLNNVSFVLNRAGYIPSLFAEIRSFLKQLTHAKKAR